MKNICVFLSENFQFLEIKFSIYLNRRVFVMCFNNENYWTTSVDPVQKVASDQVLHYLLLIMQSVNTSASSTVNSCYLDSAYLVNRLSRS